MIFARKIIKVYVIIINRLFYTNTCHIMNIINYEKNYEMYTEQINKLIFIIY